MVNQASLVLPVNWQQSLRVKPMDDGGMGSLMLFPDGKETDKPVFGRTVFEYEFKDADRANVLASLNLDERGQLFELDIWKVNFEPLIKFPEI